MPDQIRPNFIYFSKFLFNLKTANELLISLEKKILKKKKKRFVNFEISSFSITPIAPSKPTTIPSDNRTLNVLFSSLTNEKPMPDRHRTRGVTVEHVREENWPRQIELFLARGWKD